MSWFTKFFLHPAAAVVAASPAASAATAEAASTMTTAVATTVGAATSAVDPMINELVAGAEALLDAYLGKVGIVGLAISPAANLALSLGAAAAKAAIDGKLAALTTPAATHATAS